MIILTQCSVYQTSPRIENPLWQVWDQHNETFPEWANKFFLQTSLIQSEGKLILTLGCAEQPHDSLVYFSTEHFIDENDLIPKLQGDLWSLYIHQKRRILKPRGLWKDSVVSSFSGGVYYFKES